ncbi:MAG TPA: 16S rRNA (cytosine(1402)-N(4))-methyltransferase RsmH [Acidimicrobiales bacterium]|nr:16S rRNA (cytosine(1402)-N(4))-methyltransferase RsmH [Acidimicrobiales bacterium]
MTRAFHHEPVMLAEVVDLLADTPQGVLLDATVGGGGHARALLRASNRHRLIGLDRDPVAVEAARAALEPFGPRAVVVRARFDELRAVLDREAPGEPLSGVLFDLGVSSAQFDQPERGFSYRFDGPLDMRMDPDAGLRAADIVNGWPAEELAELFVEHGEVRFARRIARAIVSARPLDSTTELAEVVRHALPAPARRGGGHPARRVFQALRVTVNGELAQLPQAVEAALAALTPGGRAVVISYHSGEDRIVKQLFAAAAAGWCRCPTGLPCLCGAMPAVRLLRRGARTPSPSEQAANPRSSSARLRAAERLEAPWRPPRPGRGEV